MKNHKFCQISISTPKK